MGLFDLIAGGMDATAATELLLNVIWTIVGATLFTLCRLDLQCVKPDLPEQKYWKYTDEKI